MITGRPSFSVTVGNPSLGFTITPFGPGSCTATRSTTKSKVSPTSMPACGLPPEESYPSDPGIAITTRLPCFCPTKPLPKPGTTWSSGNATGWPVVNDSSNILPVRPSTP